MRCNPRQLNIALAWLKSCHHVSRGKQIWAFLLVISSIAVLVSVCFQWWLDWAPCQWCLYQRLAMIGICLTSAGQLSLSRPNRRAGGSLLLLASSGGFLSAVGQLMTQRSFQTTTSKSFFLPCTVKIPFPAWFPLDHWFPGFLRSTIDCSVTGSGLVVQFIPWLTAPMFMLSAMLALFLLRETRSVLKRSI